MNDATFAPADKSYPVEVSGWDNNEEFFVEKTELHWSEAADKHILLEHPVVSGALVFLRLIDPFSVQRVYPVPYHAEPLKEAHGQKVIRLTAALGR